MQQQASSLGLWAWVYVFVQEGGAAAERTVFGDEPTTEITSSAAGNHANASINRSSAAGVATGSGSAPSSVIDATSQQDTSAISTTISSTTSGSSGGSSASSSTNGTNSSGIIGNSGIRNGTGLLTTAPPTKPSTMSVALQMFKKGLRWRLTLRVIAVAMTSAWRAHNLRIDEGKTPACVFKHRLAACKSPLNAILDQFACLQDIARLRWCGILHVPGSVAAVAPPQSLAQELIQLLVAIACPRGWTAAANLQPPARLILLLEDDAPESALLEGLLADWRCLLELEDAAAQGDETAQTLVSQLWWRENVAVRFMYALLQHHVTTMTSSASTSASTAAPPMPSSSSAAQATSSSPGKAPARSRLPPLLLSLLRTTFVNLAESRVIESLHKRLRAAGERPAAATKRSSKDGGIRQRSLEQVTSNVLEARGLAHPPRVALDAASKMPSRNKAKLMLLGACEPRLRNAPRFLSSVMEPRGRWASPAPRTAAFAASGWHWARYASTKKLDLVTGWCGRLVPSGHIVHDGGDVWLHLDSGHAPWSTLVLPLRKVQDSCFVPSGAACLLAVHEGCVRGMHVSAVKPRIVENALQLESASEPLPILTVALLDTAVLRKLDDTMCRRLCVLVGAPTARSRTAKLSAIAEAWFQNDVDRLAAARDAIAQLDTIVVEEVDALMTEIVAAADEPAMLKEAAELADLMRRRMHQAQSLTTMTSTRTGDTALPSRRPATRIGNGDATDDARAAAMAGAHVLGRTPLSYLPSDQLISTHVYVRGTCVRAHAVDRRL